MGAPINIATRTAVQNVLAGTGLSLTVGAGGVPAGATIFLRAVLELNIAGTLTVTDSGGNTYFRAAFDDSNPASTPGVALYYAFNVTPLLVGQTITVKPSTFVTISGWTLVADYSTDTLIAASLDQTAAGDDGGTPGTAVDSGASPALSQSGELVYCAVAAWNGSNIVGTFAPAAGYTALTSANVTRQSFANTANFGSWAEPGVNTPVHAQGTLGTVSNWAAVVATFKLVFTPSQPLRLGIRQAVVRAAYY